MNILVVGGAGYIGSHMVKLLIEEKHDVTVIDNLSNGHRDAISKDAVFILGDINNRSLLDKILSENFNAVIHFASFIQVGESIDKPSKYYNNNVTNSLNLLDAMIQSNCKTLIFSSTAALFGEPEYIPIDEQHPCKPINPYGQSKLMVERILNDYGKAYKLKHISLRYFNASGAAGDATLGERHSPETHLIPLVLQVATKQRTEITVFGDDYETPDGTCIRDYIHVTDLCSAHLLALKKLIKDGQSGAYNLGNGNGFSVKEVINSAQSITEQEIKVKIAPRRTGDPARLVADSTLAKKELGWNPSHSDLHQIISDSWQWELSSKKHNE